MKYKKFKHFINEVFDIRKDHLDNLHPDLTKIDLDKNGIERHSYTDLNGELRSFRLPYREHLYHAHIPSAPEKRKNLWVSVIHYPRGYIARGLVSPHLQVHYDMSHVTPEMYNEEKKKDPNQLSMEVYSNAFKLHGDGLDMTNQYAGIQRPDSKGSPIHSTFVKIAPHIISAAWDVSKQHKDLPIAFSAGADDPTQRKRKFLLYAHVADELKRKNLTKNVYMTEPDYNTSPELMNTHIVIEPNHG